MAARDAYLIAHEAETISASAMAIAEQLRRAPPAINQGDQILTELRQGFDAVNRRLDNVITHQKAQ
jgi:hypothetical protein